jgi:glycosyltransferase involved in cell wall biosynthesis
VVSPIRNVVVGSAYLWRADAKVGLHYLGQHLLAHGCRLDWFTVPLSALHLLKPRVARIKRPFLSLALSGGQRFVEGEGWVVNHVPLTLAHAIPGRRLLGSSWLSRNYLRLTCPSLPALACRAGVDPVDLLLFDCGGIDLYRVFGRRAQRVIYRVSDFVSEFPNQLPERTRLEREIIQRADVLLLAYETMREEAVAIRGHAQGVYVLPNGGDFELFQQSAPPPPEYQDIPTPRAVYVGTMTGWFNWDLVLGAARLLPEVSFCLLGRGPVPTDMPANVHYLGACPHEQVPGYLQHADVGLIPFLDLPRIRRIDRPLKYYEYLASGLPIAATPHGHLADMAPHARFGVTPETYAEAIRQSLGANAEERAALMAEAAPHSWRNTLARLDDILAQEGMQFA